MNCVAQWVKQLWLGVWFCLLPQALIKYVFIHFSNLLGPIQCLDITFINAQSAWHAHRYSIGTCFPKQSISSKQIIHSIKTKKLYRCKMSKNVFDAGLMDDMLSRRKKGYFQYNDWPHHAMSLYYFWLTKHLHIWGIFSEVIYISWPWAVPGTLFLMHYFFYFLFFFFFGGGST